MPSTDNVSLISSLATDQSNVSDQPLLLDTSLSHVSYTAYLDNAFYIGTVNSSL